MLQKTANVIIQQALENARVPLLNLINNIVFTNGGHALLHPGLEDTNAKNYLYLDSFQSPDGLSHVVVHYEYTLEGNRKEATNNLEMFSIDELSIIATTLSRSVLPYDNYIVHYIEEDLSSDDKHLYVDSQTESYSYAKERLSFLTEKLSGKQISCSPNDEEKDFFHNNRHYLIKISGSRKNSSEMNEWFSSLDFRELNKITRLRESDFDPQDGSQAFIDACHRWWDNLSFTEKEFIYRQHI